MEMSVKRRGFGDDDDEPRLPIHEMNRAHAIRVLLDRKPTENRDRT
jgi:hypothetical protein